MIWTLSTSQRISYYISNVFFLLNNLHVSDQIQAFKKLLCLCLNCSLCLECPSHLHLSNFSSFFRTPFEHHLFRQAFSKLFHAWLPPLPLGYHTTLCMPHLIYDIRIFCSLTRCTKLWLFASVACPSSVVLFLFFSTSPSLNRVWTQCAVVTWSKYIYVYHGCISLVAVKNPSASACQCRRHRFKPRTSKIPWSRKWQPTLVFCLGNPMDRGERRLQSMGSQRVGHDLATKWEHILLVFCNFPNSYVPI